MTISSQEVQNPDTQEIETVYRPGDSALAVMRDLKRLWRKDDTDDERTVFRCFAKAGLCTELVSLLDECTGRGQSGRKMALAAADLLAALTWPIDVQQELKDMLEDAESVVTDYASLLRSQVEYKVSDSINHHA
jgi:replication fork protection complex subunit Tof1/Swi1